MGERCLPPSVFTTGGHFVLLRRKPQRQRGGATHGHNLHPALQGSGWKTAIQTMEERFAYGLNPKKLGAVSAYLCDPASAPAEFLLVKASTRRKRAGPWSAGPCSFRSGRRSRPVRSRRRRQTKSAMKRPCAGQRASTSFLSVPTFDKGPHSQSHLLQLHGPGLLPEVP